MLDNIPAYAFMYVYVCELFSLWQICLYLNGYIKYNRPDATSVIYLTYAYLYDSPVDVTIILDDGSLL